MSKTEKTGKKQVLIVEDSEDFSNLLKFVIEDDGFEAVQFPVAGDDIIAWAKKLKPAVIVMDLALRRKDGLEYINELKADPATKKVPVVIVSGRDLTHKEILDLQVRDVRYLRKGRVEMDEIKQEIRSAAGVKPGMAAGPAPHPGDIPPAGSR